MKTRILVVVVFIAICIYQLNLGLLATAGMEWPSDPDLCRDMSIAQSFLDQQSDTDYAYFGEKQWYNPLIPALTALFASITLVPLNIIYAKGGAYINLVIPLVAFLFVGRLFNQRVALATVFGMVFIVQTAVCGYSYQLHTYQPIMFTSMLGQLFLYTGWGLGLELITRKSKQQLILFSALWLGLTFLVHTAQALQLGIFFSTIILWPRFAESCDWKQLTKRLEWQRLAHLSGMLVIAFAISWPITKNILFHYQLHIKNPFPSSWIAPPVDLRNLPCLLFSYIKPTTLITLTGAWRLFFKSDRSRTVLLWTGIAICWIVAGYFVQGIRHMFGVSNLSLPVPTVHFFITLKFIESLLFGYGLVVLCDKAGDYIANKVTADGWHSKVRDRLPNTFSNIANFNLTLSLLFLVFTISAGMLISNQKQQEMLVNPYRHVQNIAEEKLLYNFFKKNASTSTVVLAEPNTALLYIVPSGAKTVVVPPYHSSPYVEWSKRDIAMKTMYKSLRDKNLTEFERIAKKYNITYVVLEKKDKMLQQSKILDIAFLTNKYLVGKVKFTQQIAPTAKENSLY